MSEYKWLIENLPVAAALIIMTKMWLNHLKSSDESARDTFRAIANECEVRAEDNKKVIKENTDVLGQVKQVMESGKGVMAANTEALRAIESKLR